jgi:phosphoglycerate dehydrogenase-like enzyme
MPRAARRPRRFTRRHRAQAGSLRPDALILRAGKITADVLDAGATLRVVCRHGAGTDNIDVEAATRRGTPVLSTPLANFDCAEHALARILALTRRLTVHDRHIRGGGFDKRTCGRVELHGKTLGLVGFGHVGRRCTSIRSRSACRWSPMTRCARPRSWRRRPESCRT